MLKQFMPHRADSKRQLTTERFIPAAWGSPSPAGEDSIWTQNPSSRVDAKINVRRSDHRVAPEGIFFDLTLVGFNTNTLPNAAEYDPSYHDKYVFWDYGEEYFFTAPVQILAMDAADGGNRNNARYSRGPLGSHVFRTPGVHVVRVAVVEPSSGKVGFGQVELSVGDPEKFYAGNTTLFVDVTGSYANAPVGSQKFRNLDAALSVLNTATTPHRIVLERGQTHIMSAPFGYRAPPNASGISLRLEARVGQKNNPIISVGTKVSDDSILFFENSLRNMRGKIGSGVTFRGIDFQGPWDVATPAGRKVACLVFNGVYGSSNVVIDQCNFSGWATTFYVNGVKGRTPDRTVFFNDVGVSNWAGIGFFGGADSTLSFTGCGFVQGTDAVTRQSQDNKSLGPLRVSSSRMCNIWACDFFSSTGWSPYSSIIAIQPAIRWNTSPNVMGARLNLQACAIESGRLALSLKPQNTGQARMQANAIVEGNIAISGFQGSAVADIAFGGTTLRNNILVFSGNKNSAPIGGQNQGIRGFIWLYGGAQAKSKNEAIPLLAYNNTLVNLTNTNAREFEDSIGFANLIMMNNLVHQPHLSVPETPFAPLFQKLAFASRYKGYRPNNSTLHGTYANPENSGSMWIPQISSRALGAALSEPDAYTDFKGNRRPEPPSTGAMEAD